MAPVLEIKDGVKIAVYSRDHLPPHIHAKHAEHEVMIDIRTSEIVEGDLPNKKLKVVKEWLDEDGNRELAEENFYELNPRLAPKEEKKEEKKEDKPKKKNKK